MEAPNGARGGVGGSFLLSVDLEDIRSMIPGGERYADRVPLTTGRLLDYLEARDLRITFFTVGDVARRYPELVRRIVAAGHEIACHTSDHVTLDRRDAAGLRDDLERCRDDFAKAGAGDVVGFRAPIGSLVRETAWAYAVLSELGFRYSSSVFPAASPLYGWADFGSDTPCIREGVWELPQSLMGPSFLRVPIASGIYFRIFPFPWIRYEFRRWIAGGSPVVAYLHPYDIDTGQERMVFPELEKRPFLNWLMYRRRGSVLRRLDGLLALGAPVTTYADFVATVLEPRRSVAASPIG